MANWSKHIEDITGLPVFKRAKHGIHFQRPDGQIEASFSGKPCHHFADGIWKPIDTKLVLLPDGFYGCAHSDVRIHPDGRVAVTGTSYQQRAELPSAKTGLADNDRMIRQFSFGSQELRITEDGFKSEITLNRIPTLTEAKKLIASESGTLSKKYLKSLTTATDANGDVHTFTTLSAFRTWLASAVFPIIIDPDFGSPTDFRLNTDSAVNYATARAANPWANYNNGTTYGDNFGNYKDGEKFRQQRALVKIDTSSIGAGSTVTQVNLKLTGSGNRTKISLYVVNYDWSSTDPVTTGNKQAAFGGMTGETGEQGFTSVSTSGTTSSNLSTTLINKSGTTYFGITGVQDYNQTETNDGASSGIYASGATTEGYRPVLTVTYTASGIAIPVAQYYYNRLRRN